jgi:hypothetical protein
MKLSQTESGTKKQQLRVHAEKYGRDQIKRAVRG